MKPKTAQDFGKNEWGLNSVELMSYIKYRVKTMRKTRKVYKKLMEWFIGQTGIMDDKGEFIYYYHDIERGLDLILKGKETYFD